MANKSFGVKELSVIGAGQTPTIESVSDIIVNANKVAISTNVTVGNYVGIGTTNPTKRLHVFGDALITGVVTASSFVGNLTGTATTALGFSATASINTSGIITASRINVGTSGTTIPGAKLNVVDNSSSDALRITQTGSGNALVVEDSTNPDSTPVVISATGNIGIGTTNPVGQLQISTGPVIIGTATSTGTASQRLQVLVEPQIHLTH
jgi:hypothetical protein